MNVIRGATFIGREYCYLKANIVLYLINDLPIIR